ncbi:MAG: helix-turn-helix domain-containing protein [Sphingomonadaceae bacterium]
MIEDSELPTDQLPLDNTGQRLRRAREAAGITVEQIAAETRIPQRHIETIERGDFASLPSRTYALGFSRTYAKALGLDEKGIAAQLRAELGQSGPERTVTPRYEPGDPARVPSRTLAWLSALAAVVLLAGGFAFFRTFWAPGTGPAPLEAPAPEAPEVPEGSEGGEARATPGAMAAGQVVFTALEDEVWVKFYDASGAQLMQKQMALNERYVVPVDAEGPQVWTGRPNALRITVGGKPVPKLSETERVVKDVPVSAEALLARTPPSS